MSSGCTPCFGWVLPATCENFAALNATLSDEDASAVIECLGLVGLSEEGLNRELRKDEELFRSVLDALDEHCENAHTFTLTLQSPEDEVFTAKVSLFRHDSDQGDVYDELEDGQYYFGFDRDDLFDLSPLGRLLKKQNLMPPEQGRTSYG